MEVNFELSITTNKLELNVLSKDFIDATCYN